MDPLTLAALGGGVGGRVLAGIGQHQGAKAAARERERQIAEQAAIQAEADRATAAELSLLDPLAQTHSAVPAVQALDTGLAAATQAPGIDQAALQAAGNAGAQQAATSARLADLSRGAANNRSRLRSVGAIRAGAADKASTLSRGYDLATHAAAGKGSVLRGIGGLLTPVSDAGLSAAAFSAGRTAGQPAQARNRQLAAFNLPDDTPTVEL